MCVYIYIYIYIYIYRTTENETSSLSNAQSDPALRDFELVTLRAPVRRLMGQRWPKLECRLVFLARGNAVGERKRQRDRLRATDNGSRMQTADVRGRISRIQHVGCTL